MKSSQNAYKLLPEARKKEKSEKGISKKPNHPKYLF